MSNLVLAKSEMFGESQCDIYQNPNNEIFMTSKQIGLALGYSNPQQGLSNILSRSEYLKKPEFSVVLNLRTTDGKAYNTRLFTEDGIYEIAFKSDAPNAQDFRFWVRRVIKGIRQEIQIQNKARESGKEFQPTDIFNKFFQPDFKFEDIAEYFEKPKSGLEVLTELFNQNSNRLPQPEFESSYAYLWRALTADMPAPSIVPTPTPMTKVPTTPMKPSPKKKMAVATNAVADKAMELIKAFIKKHSRTFDPRYGIRTKDYIFIRNSVFNEIITKDCPRQAVLRNLASRGLIKAEPCWENDTYTRYAFRKFDRHLDKNSFYIAIRVEALK
jgi:prophage antirepressor-like protein